MCYSSVRARPSLLRSDLVPIDIDTIWYRAWVSNRYYRYIQRYTIHPGFSIRSAIIGILSKFNLIFHVST